MRLNRGGFSLLELLIVTLMISMICGRGVLRLGDTLAGYELSAAALELAADLRWMQQASVNSPIGAGGPFYSMVFSQATNAGYYVKAGVQICKRSVLPASLRFVSLPPNIYFAETGSPANPQSIAIRNTKLNKTRYVIIAAVTGRVRVSDTAAWE